MAGPTCPSPERAQVRGKGCQVLERMKKYPKVSLALDLAFWAQACSCQGAGAFEGFVGPVAPGSAQAQVRPSAPAQLTKAVRPGGLQEAGLL